ncbi:hypothetical protein KM868_11870 [Micrococcus luteus]|uniref:hypothetical protein n=1 Tax=Micrococcus luteus TaxID=1270 RepID=UPI001C21B7B5|nr:hypothetical protein [Micrococcus luteus]MBU8764189.1 hypothetical protein [Micrococcus luteus]
MPVDQALRLTSPETYTYNRRYLGKEINVVELNKMWKNYVEQMYVEQLEQACRATDCIAVRSSILTRYEKEQHKQRRYTAGKRVYYLFPAQAVPQPIFCKLPPGEKLIYE